MHGRRQLLRRGLAIAGGAAVAALSAASPAAALPNWLFPEWDVRRVKLDNLHTGEKLDVAYWERGAYVPDALVAVNRVLRDYRTGEMHAIDPRLLDLLTAISGRVGARAPYGVISGYRSPATNAMLHAESGEVASHSLHLVGQAIDIRAPGIELAWLREAAKGLERGGVGYYPISGFVHVDVGRVRAWSGT